MPDAVFLAVDPDQTVLSFVRRFVTSRGYEFLGARRGEDALRRVAEKRPDAIVARVGLPDMTGPELVSRLRQEMAGGPPILLTALRGQEAEASAGLEQGAVNVLFFPFTEVELSSRLGTLIRGARRPADDGVLSVGKVSVDLEKGEILKPQMQPLTSSEVEILRWLLSPPGRAVTRRQFPVGTERAVDVHVASLRSKLGSESDCIETVRGIGYRFRVAAAL